MALTLLLNITQAYFYIDQTSFKIMTKVLLKDIFTD